MECLLLIRKQDQANININNTLDLLEALTRPIYMGLILGIEPGHGHRFRG